MALKPVLRTRAAVIALLGVLGVLLVLWGLGAFLVTGDPLTEADAVVLLAGGGDERLEEAVNLYRKRFANAFVIVETGERVGDTAVDLIDLVRRQLIDRNVPSDAILHTEPAPNSTAGEAKQVRALLEARKMGSVIVVTDPYHTRRTAMVYRQVFEGSDIRVIIRPAGGHWFQAASWWLRPAGWRVVFLEYGKLAATLLGIGSE